MTDVVHLIIGLGDGGAEHTLYKVATMESSLSQSVISLTDNGKYGQRLSDKGIKVYTLGAGRIIDCVVVIWMLLRHIRIEGHPRVLHCWMYHAELLSIVVRALMGSRTRIIWSLRNTPFSARDNFSSFIVSRICMLFSRWIPDLTISCGQRTLDEHVSLGWRPKQTRVIHNGVDLRIFRPKESGYDNGSNKNNSPLVVGMVARFDKQKGHEIFIRALSAAISRGVEMRCILVGRHCDQHNPQLMGMLRRYALERYTLLYGQRIDMPDLYGEFDVTCLPSIYGEGCPNVVLESMACGTPVVATDVGDSSCLLNGAGWIVPPGDPDALTEALVNIANLKRDGRLFEYKELALARIKSQFDLEEMLSCYAAVYSDVAQTMR